MNKLYASLTREEEVHSMPQPHDSSSEVLTFIVKTPTSRQSDVSALYMKLTCFLLHGFQNGIENTKTHVVEGAQLMEKGVAEAE